MKTDLKVLAGGWHEAKPRPQPVLRQEGIRLGLDDAGAPCSPSSGGTEQVRRIGRGRGARRCVDDRGRGEVGERSHRGDRDVRITRPNEPAPTRDRCGAAGGSGPSATARLAGVPFPVSSKVARLADAP